jgi:hypothetical protein
VIAARRGRYLGAFGDRLLAAGKAKRARSRRCQKKFLDILNAVIRDKRKWQPHIA